MTSLYSRYSRPIYWEGERGAEKRYAIAYVEEALSRTVIRKGKKVITDIFTVVLEQGAIVGDEMRTMVKKRKRFVKCDGDSHSYGAALGELDKFIVNIENVNSLTPIF